MADGAARFGQGSSGPALLRVRTRCGAVPRTGLSPAAARLPRHVPLQRLFPCRPPYNPGCASTPPVWARPLSLAATRGVTVVLLSSAYLDVSVRRVRLRLAADATRPAWRVAPFGHPRITGRSRLPAAFRSLPRPSSPPGAKASPVRPMVLVAYRARPPLHRRTLMSILALRFAPHVRSRELSRTQRTALSCHLSRLPSILSKNRGARAPWWRMRDSNPRPPACKAGALAI